MYRLNTERVPGNSGRNGLCVWLAFLSSRIFFSNGRSAGQASPLTSRGHVARYHEQPGGSSLPWMSPAAAEGQRRRRNCADRKRKLFNLSRSDTVPFEADSTDQGSAPESPFPQTLSDRHHPQESTRGTSLLSSDCSNGIGYTAVAPDQGICVTNLLLA